MLRPLDDRVLVEPLEVEDKTPGGILLPDQAKEKPRRGKVLAVGPGRWLHSGPISVDFAKYAVSGGDIRLPMSVKVGDIVCYPAFTGQEIKDGDKTLIIMSESEVLAIE